MKPPLVFAITGASGAPYAVRLLEVLARKRVPVWLLVSAHGLRLLKEECGLASLAALERATGPWKTVEAFDDGDRGGRPASGSARTAGMVVCPCSMATLAAIAHGTSRSLIERAADVTLKERRQLILVPREAPYSSIHLEHMLKLSNMGVTILPASPGFYHQPQTIDDLIDFVVARILNLLNIPQDMLPRWGEYHLSSDE